MPQQGVQSTGVWLSIYLSFLWAPRLKGMAGIGVMDSTISAAWIQAGTAIVLALFTTLRRAGLFYQINQLHCSNWQTCATLPRDLMRTHEH